MKIRVEMVLAFVLLVSALCSFTQQAFAEDARYVYPVIETNCEQIDVATYRFYPGDSLNFTFTFQGPVTVCYAENWTCRTQIEYPPGYYTENSYARFYEFWINDGKNTGNCSTSAALSGSDFSRWKSGFPDAGEHSLKIVYLFKGYGGFKGFYEMSFLSERKARLEELTLPTSTTLLLITGVSGAGIAFAVSGAVVWYKRNLTKKAEDNVSS